MKKLFFLAVFVLALAGIVLASSGGGVKKKRPLPHEYGRVIINNYSEKAGFAPVVFDHWLHRSQFTCRLCHVDIAFGMKAGASGIKAADNMKGFYCGTCHNGKMTVDGKRSSSPAGSQRIRSGGVTGAIRSAKATSNRSMISPPLPRNSRKRGWATG
jgi:c(7)-type cytochrome triheme protein